LTYDIHNVIDHGIDITRAVKLYSFSRFNQSNECIVQTVDNLIGGASLFSFLSLYPKNRCRHNAKKQIKRCPQM